MTTDSACFSSTSSYEDTNYRARGIFQGVSLHAVHEFKDEKLGVGEGGQNPGRRVPAEARSYWGALETNDSSQCGKSGFGGSLFFF